MDKLTPELERRLQVEELWARRNVLADSINAERKQRFLAQHTVLTQLGTSSGGRLNSEPHRFVKCAEVRGSAHEALSSNAGSSTDSFANPKFKGPRSALLVGLPLTAVLATAALALAPMQRVSSGLIEGDLGKDPIHVEAAFLGSEPKSKNDFGTGASHGSIAVPNLRAEVAAKITASLQRRQHNSEALRAVQSDQGAPNIGTKPL